MTEHRRRLRLVYQRAYRKRLRLRGLTCRLTARKNRCHSLPIAGDADTKRSNAHARYLERRARLYAQGRTVHRGTLRKPLYYKTAVEQKERKSRVQRLRRECNVAKGLTINGAPRKRGIVSQIALDYRAFRNSMNLPDTRDWTDLVAFESRSNN